MAVTLDWWSLPVGWVAKMGWAPKALGASLISTATMAGGGGGGAGLASGARGWGPPLRVPGALVLFFVALRI